MHGLRLTVLILPLLLLAACSSDSNRGRYSMSHDAAPERPVDVSRVPDAVPRDEPRSRGGNKSPYEVLGKKYWVMNSALGYQAVGTASWYGRKFHGHATSNGETYDMYAMTAAHKTLPLPTYLRVTNLANNRQVIVRVNDRGPFHDNRLIDLSYAAAARLDMLGHGTARVRLEAIDTRAWQNSRQVLEPQTEKNAQLAIAGRYLQVGSYTNADNAKRVETLLRSELSELAVLIRPVTQDQLTFYRVHIGPLQASTSLPLLTQQLERLGFAGAQLVDFP